MWGRVKEERAYGQAGLGRSVDGMHSVCSPRLSGTDGSNELFLFDSKLPSLSLPRPVCPPWWPHLSEVTPKGPLLFLRPALAMIR